MEFELTLSNGRTPYVIVRVPDSATKAMSHECLQEAAALGQQNSVHRFLFDLSRVANQRSTLDDYTLAYRGLQELGFARPSLAALLVAPDDASHAFFEIVARNAGYHWKLFTDERMALAWLVGRDTSSGHPPKCHMSGGKDSRCRLRLTRAMAC